MQTKIYAEVLEHEALSQFHDCLKMEGCIQGALMPDAHAGYVAPIGSVLKFEGRISPALIGYDIGCGMSSIKTDVIKDQLDLDKLKTDILKVIPIGRNSFKRSSLNRPKQLPTLPKGTEFGEKVMENKGVYQLGTLGGGNHFIEIGEGDDGKLSVIIHSGSRNVGKQIAEHYMKQAAIYEVDYERYEKEFDSLEKNKQWLKATVYSNAKMTDYNKAKEEFVYRRTRARVDNIEGCYSFDTDSEQGKNYIKDMNLALEYALASRKAMVNKVIGCIEKNVGGLVNTERFINRNHNHADIQDNIVIHRKGATHAEDGMFGVIPGNMRDGSFIVKGKGNVESMSSSSHGAGRVLSRRKAKEQLSLDTFHEHMAGITTNHTDANLDESPDAYKSIFEVMELQKDLVEVIDHIKPILNIKG